jgi:hypothetical protein
MDNSKLKYIQEKIRNIDHETTMVIYGAGTHTEQLIDKTNIKTKNIIGILDKRADEIESKSFKGLDVFLPECVKDIKPDVVLVSSLEHQDEITNHLLTDLNYKGQILTFYDSNDIWPFYQYLDKPVYYLSKYKNIYFCTIQKAASQWMKGILSDDYVYQYSGLFFYDHHKRMPGRADFRKITEASFNEPFPENTIVGPLYVDYKNYENIPKDREYKSFYVVRDPRDLVVSYYFSKKYSHPIMGGLGKIRNRLNDLDDIGKGLIYIIDLLNNDGTFDAVRSWSKHRDNSDEITLILKYENITDKSRLFYKRLFSYLDINIPEELISYFENRYSFENLSFGRKKGEEDVCSHYRKGIHGDWKNYFTEEVKMYFKNVTRGLLEDWGYEENTNW